MMIKRQWQAPPTNEIMGTHEEGGDVLVQEIMARANVQSMIIMFSDGSSVLYEDMGEESFALHRSYGDDALDRSDCAELDREAEERRQQ